MKKKHQYLKAKTEMKLKVGLKIVIKYCYKILTTTKRWEELKIISRSMGFCNKEALL
jgi:hypothetical protein